MSLDASDILHDARAHTLTLVASLDDHALRAWPDPEFSPICWHLGHVAYTEALWVLERSLGDDSLTREHRKRFAQGGRPKAERSEMPGRAELFDYLATVRARVLDAWTALEAREDDPFCQRGYAAWFLACHEHQHRETMAVVRGLTAAALASEETNEFGALVDDGDPPMIELQGCEAEVGVDHPHAYDNERPAVIVGCDDFALDAHPVTNAAWLRFMRDDGYRRPELWSEAGWRWRQGSGVGAPSGWLEGPEDRWARARLEGTRPLDGREPVVGVSHHEAEAFARWRGCRLPTEVEWELAARRFGALGESNLGLEYDGPLPVRLETGRCTDLIGNAWEWTACAFAPRPGFESFPYPGYSAPYFDGAHRVMRGGSFATHPAVARATFRNWYAPDTRQTFSGLRCARGEVGGAN